MKENFLKYLPVNISEKLKELSSNFLEKIIELRLRINQPVMILTSDSEYFISKKGGKIEAGLPGMKIMNNNIENSFWVSEKDLQRAFMILSKNSVYALERQLSQGFITIPGGHRVGFTGQVITQNSKIKTIKNINSLNYRITSEMKGIGERVVQAIYSKRRDCVYNTLIIAGPLCGKTTLLRDIIRTISSGHAGFGIRGKKVGLVDERSEIAGAYQGIPQNSIGYRTDVLDNCPKAEGIMLLIRSMSPEVIAVDEIGSREDITAIQKALTAGVSLICTVHGSNLNELKKRPGMAEVIKSKLFERYIILSRRQGIGTFEAVLDENGREVSLNYAQEYRSSPGFNFR